MNKLTRMSVLSLVAAIGIAACAKEAASASPAAAGATAAAADSPKARSARAAVDAYNAVRSALAADNLANAKAAAPGVKAKVEALRADFADKAADIGTMVSAADRIAAAADLKLARNIFGELSRSLIGFLAADKSLHAGLVCYRCPMTKTYQKWLQVGDAMGNPYHGTEMLTCGVKVAIAP